MKVKKFQILMKFSRIIFLYFYLNESAQRDKMAQVPPHVETFDQPITWHFVNYGEYKFW